MRKKKRDQKEEKKIHEKDKRTLRNERRWKQYGGKRQRERSRRRTKNEAV